MLWSWVSGGALGGFDKRPILDVEYYAIMNTTELLIINETSVSGIVAFSRLLVDANANAQ